MQEKNYKALTIPKLKWGKAKKVGISSERIGELIVEPLEPGFGITRR